MELCVLVEDAGAPLNPTKIARLRNTPQTAVQHDQVSRQGRGFCAPDRLHGAPRRCYTSPRLPLPAPPFRPPPPCPPPPRPRPPPPPPPPPGSRCRAPLPAACCRHDSPPHAGRGQPGVGTELAGDE